MDIFQDPVFWSRMQFALTAIFHILWPITTVGISLTLLAFEAIWLKTGDVDYYRHARFWSKLFLLNFSVGIVSGIPLEFEFGTNWSRFSIVAGEFFGNILGYESAMAFMLEAGFLGIMLFGWGRVAPPIHLLATSMVALGATLSAFWILVANSWMQTPSGIHLENQRVVVDSYFDAIFNPNMPWGVLHMWFACLTTSLFVIGGLSAWYLLKAQATAFFLKSFRFALLGLIAVVPIQLALGHGSGLKIFVTQPAKAAAIEAHWKTNSADEGAAWNLLVWPDQAGQKNVWSLSVPNVLSYLATGSSHGQVRGLKSFAPEDQPPALPLLFYSFRLMVAIGLLLFGLVVWTTVCGFKGRLLVDSIGRQRRLLQAWVLAIPLGYVATECGWIVREVGRQPWIIYGILRTHDAASTLPIPVVVSSLAGFVLIYTLLFMLFLMFAGRILRHGPDLSLMAPS